MLIRLQKSDVPYSLVGIRLADLEAHAESLRIRLLATPGQLRLGLRGEEVSEVTEGYRTTLLGALAQCEATIAALEYFDEKASEERFRATQCTMSVSLPQQARPLKGVVAVLPAPAKAVSAAAAD